LKGVSGGQDFKYSDEPFGKLKDTEVFEDERGRVEGFTYHLPSEKHDSPKIQNKLG